MKLAALFRSKSEVSRFRAMVATILKREKDDDEPKSSTGMIDSAPNRLERLGQRQSDE